MTEIIKIDLDGEGTRFVNSRLKEGGAISRSFLRMVGAIDNAFAPLPETTDRAGKVDFGRGDRTTQKATLRWLASYTKPYNGFGWCLLVEDPWSKLADLLTQKLPVHAFTYQESVVYGISGVNFDEYGFKAILRSVPSFDYIGFIAQYELPEGRAIGISRILTEDTVIKFVNHTRLVLASAFDRDGLVVSEVSSL